MSISDLVIAHEPQQEQASASLYAVMINPATEGTGEPSMSPLQKSLVASVLILFAIAHVAGAKMMMEKQDTISVASIQLDD
jgi:hypothetical protein